MSLEIALEENTQALKALFALLAAGSGKQMSAAEYLASLSAPTESASAAQEKNEIPKPASTPAATAKAPAVKPAAAAASPSDPVDYNRQVKPLLLKVSANKGRDTLVALLAKFGATKGDQLPADKLGAVLVEAETLLAA